MLCEWCAARLDHLRNESRRISAPPVPKFRDGRLHLLHAEWWYLVVRIVVASVVAVPGVMLVIVLIAHVAVVVSAVVVCWGVGGWGLLCEKCLVEGCKDVCNGLSVRLLSSTLRSHARDQGLLSSALDAADLLQSLKLQQDVLDMAPAMDALQDLDFLPDELAQLPSCSHFVVVEALSLCDQVVELVALVVCVACGALLSSGRVDNGIFNLPAAFIDPKWCR